MDGDVFRSGSLAALRRLLLLSIVLWSFTGCAGGTGGDGGSAAPPRSSTTEFPVEPLAVIEQLRLAYNDERYHEFWQLFDAELAIRCTEDQLRMFLSRVKSVFGRWSKIESLSIFRGRAAHFVAVLERGQWEFSLILTSQGRIEDIRQGLPRTALGLPVPPRNSVKLSPPFRGLWYVEAGGDTDDLNSLSHLVRPDARRAFDFLIRDESGRPYRNQGHRVEDYYAWGQEVLSPGDGCVVKVEDGVADNVPGRRNWKGEGNAVWIRHSPEEVSLLLHLQCGSVRVKQGAQVKRGEVIARCGNSGNSDMPHLHFQLMNTDEQEAATGVKVFFERVKRIRGGEAQELDDYSPVQGDRVERTD